MEKFKDIGKPILVASHPRSGTHLTIDLLRKQFKECQSYKHFGEPLDRLYFALEAFAPTTNPLTEKTALNILSRAQRPIIKTHCSPKFAYLYPDKSDWVDWIGHEVDTYYIVRDGRDVMCSLHLFMQSYDPTTRCSLSEFIRQKINGVSRVKHWANHIKIWCEQSHVITIKFENIIQNTSCVLESIGNQLDLQPLYKESLLPSKIENIWHGRWERLTKKHPESTAIIGYYQGQKAKKWQTSFLEEDRLFFQSEAGDSLIQLAYEKDENWT